MDIKRFFELKISNKQGQLSQLQAVIDSVPGSLYWKDRQGHYLGCNDYMLSVAKLNSRDAIIGKTDRDLWPDLADELIKNDQKAMTLNQAVILEEIVHFSDGTTKSFSVVKMPLRDDRGNVIGVIGNSLDITEQKEFETMKSRLKAAEAKAEVASTLAGKMSHNVGTPLAGIQSSAELLQTLLPDFIDAYRKAKEHDLEVGNIRKGVLEHCEHALDSIAAQAIRISRFVKEMSQNIRLGVTLDQSELTACSMNARLEKIIPYYIETQKAANQHLIHWNSGDDFLFKGHEEHFTQVIENILNNAIDAIEAVGKGEIYITTKPGKDFNQLCIKDTGKGIKAEYLSRIFEPFVSYDKPMRGTGIGLASCRDAMHAFGGEIACCSEEGEYTEFVLNFPHVAEGKSKEAKHGSS